MNTNFYHNRVPTRLVELLTLKEFLQTEELIPGSYILLADVIETKSGIEYQTSGFWVGDATPYHEPSDNDGGFGWDYESDLCQKHVIEVHTFF